MKRICLLRHAKSEPLQRDQKDSDRSLNERGVAAARFMADLIIKRGYTPDAVLCSSAHRTVSTLRPLAEQLPPNVPVTKRDDLYLAMPDVLLDAVRQAPRDAITLLLVGHNPGIGLLADLLIPHMPEAQSFGEEFPTAALAVIEFDAEDWAEVSEGRGRLVFYGAPKQLMREAGLID